MAQVQTKPQTQDTPESIFEMCIKEFGITQDIPYESLSFSERMVIAFCYRMSRGGDVDLSDLEGILDEENMKKMVKIYYTLYNF